jgi:carbamoyl-phosphate synthase large subunit
MFFAVWKHAPIKTTLLRELEEVCNVTYREFEDPEELRSDLHDFFKRIAKGRDSAPRHPVALADYTAESLST